jgi:hypothetical protein
VVNIRLGRVRRHDPKSRNYAYPVHRATRGLSVKHRFGAKHVDQFYTSGCVGYSGTNLLNTAAALSSRVTFNRRVQYGLKGTTYLGNQDGWVNYSESTKRDPFPWEFPPEDEGSSALGLMKYWTELGVISGYDWTFTFDGFLAALQRQPVTLGTWWYDDMFETDIKGEIRTSLSGARGGHQYIATGILWEKRLIEYQNSWGSNPPDFRATFYMSWDRSETLIMDGGDVAVPRFLNNGKL